jgi:ferric-dicitrate binding protein FerR (iron transport regulator)
VKDAVHPFIVHTSGIDVRVLGTVFNVKSYPQDETIETTLLRGIIEVTRPNNPNSPKVILRPNEKLIFSKQLPDTGSLHTVSARAADAKQLTLKPDISVTPILKNVPDSDKIETSWVYNRLVFSGDSFQELAEKMERWYNVKIIFKNDNLLHYRFKGAFANETVREALNALQLTAKFNYQINENEIEIYKK